jgi:hypothetical protein
MGASYFRFWSRAETAMHGPRNANNNVNNNRFHISNFPPRKSVKFFLIFVTKKKELGPADANAIRRVPCPAP